VFLPRAATAGSLPLMLPRVVPPFAAALIAAQSSLVFEYVARQKIEGPALRAAHWKQLPVPTPDMLEPHLPFIVPRVLELVYTAPDMMPLARDLDDRGEDPFAWDPDRRAGLRAELDAFFFGVYGIEDRDDVEYITGTLQAGAGRPEQGEDQDHGGGRHARDLILAAYDRMAEATAAGAEYETRIFPPPGHAARSGRKPLVIPGTSTTRRRRRPGRRRDFGCGTASAIRPTSDTRTQPVSSIRTGRFLSKLRATVLCTKAFQRKFIGRPSFSGKENRLPACLGPVGCLPVANTLREPDR